MKFDSVKISKLLSLVLRHQPELIGIHLDEQGWTPVSELIEQLNLHCKTNLNLELLSDLVKHNPKQRFGFNSDGSKIRANQGHSVSIDLGYVEQHPPSILYHGTSTKALEFILKEGITKQQRHHVHLSASFETACQVGKRHGILVVLEIDTEALSKEGHRFFQSDNGVWLVDFIPVGYFKIRDETSL